MKGLSGVAGGRGTALQGAAGGLEWRACSGPGPEVLDFPEHSRKKQKLGDQRIMPTFHCYRLKSESVNCSVVSDSLRPSGLPGSWKFPDKKSGVGGHSLLQGIFPTQVQVGASQK